MDDLKSTPISASPSPSVPLALFDALEYVGVNANNISINHYKNFDPKDYQYALEFLKSYKGSIGTFNSYRREIERLLHWSFLVANKSLKVLSRNDIENFIKFCQNPPKNWIGIKKVPRFVNKDGNRIPNSEWRPFIATIAKSATKQGKIPNQRNFMLSFGTIREIFAILSSFYNYLLQEEYVSSNPVALIRQKSKFIRKSQNQAPIRRLSVLQWQYVINAAKAMAEQNPELHERTLFMISALYSMYLRISELTALSRFVPTMNNFQRDGNNAWWFTTVGKGNKERQIAVSDDMLDALKRWRKFLGLPTELPTQADNGPLIPKKNGKGPITNTSYIRKVIQLCFDKAIYMLEHDNLKEEALLLSSATVHWLRHTGISDDVKHRPREHVRDDAGHSSSSVTDKYIDIELKERHKSAKDKQIYGVEEE